MDFERVRPCAVCFRPEVGEEFDAALRTVAIFLKGNMELAGLITLLNGMEAKHADQREHPIQQNVGKCGVAPMRSRHGKASRGLLRGGG